jgi:hypothetical protein
LREMFSSIFINRLSGFMGLKPRGVTIYVPGLKAGVIEKHPRHRGYQITQAQVIKYHRTSELTKYRRTSGLSNAASLQDRQIHWPSDDQIHQTPVDQIQPGFTAIKSTRLQDHQMPLVFRIVKSTGLQTIKSTRLQLIKYYQASRLSNLPASGSSNLPGFRIIKCR